jgi:predicted 2-oxoglutarate/Fe(II)-dependent dioxygenase YbiX
MGTLVAFASDVLHEVLPVTAGIRDVVVDWFY